MLRIVRTLDDDCSECNTVVLPDRVTQNHDVNEFQQRAAGQAFAYPAEPGLSYLFTISVALVACDSVPPVYEYLPVKVRLYVFGLPLVVFTVTVALCVEPFKVTDTGLMPQE